MLHFGQALGRIKDGQRVRRACWPPQMYLALVNVGVVPAILVCGRSPWEPTQDELLATDWEDYDK